MRRFVVAGEALTPQEAEERVARIEWLLNVPDGKLAITGGAVLLNEAFGEARQPYRLNFTRAMLERLRVRARGPKRGSDQCTAAHRLEQPADAA